MRTLIHSTKSLAFALLPLIMVALCEGASGVGETPTVTVTGASPSATQQDYYVVRIPEYGSTTVTITFQGNVSLDEDEQCECEGSYKYPPEDEFMNLEYDIDIPYGAL
jgi:hypothetical protein